MSYREVLSPRIGAWAVVAVAARLPVAMAPLAFVFLVRERPGGYTTLLANPGLSVTSAFMTRCGR
ncbi:hypothetical protein ACFV0R_19940, partial [Streptomyces sp. NPDC059578]